MVLQILLLCPREPVTGPNPEPDESSPLNDPISQDPF
jgi:hypothetical protein